MKQLNYGQLEKIAELRKTDVTLDGMMKNICLFAAGNFWSLYWNSHKEIADYLGWEITVPEDLSLSRDTYTKIKGDCHGK